MKSQFLLFVVIGFFATGNALKCYHCSSLIPGCKDPFNKLDIKVEDDKAIMACVKLVIDFGSETEILRLPATVYDVSLSKSDLIKAILPKSSTSYYCTSDLCNGATSMTAALSTLIIVIIALISVK